MMITPIQNPQACDRRKWLITTAGLLGTVSLAGFPTSHRSVAHGAELGRGWIDSHVHVWPSIRAEYPLEKGFSSDVVQPAEFTPEILFQHCRPCGVERIVLIQMNFFGFDNRYMLDTIARNPGVFSGVAVIDHEQTNLRAVMSKMRDAGVRGYRLYANAENVKPWQTSPSIDAMFRFGEELGQAMCMLSDPESLEGIERLCSRYPKTTVVIDHFSRIGMREAPTDQQLDTLCRLSRFPQVYVKTSAFYALGAKQPPYIDLIPMIRRLLSVFGAERLMWGSDCPYQIESPHTYEASIALLRDHIDELRERDRQYLLRKTAERVFFS
jgi:predicted TIM-barrel fold metal-dependent hydrolase